MLRFLHLADVHFDTRFLGRSESLRQRLKEAQQRAFTRAVDCALSENLDCVLIGGDLFDGQKLSFSTERFLTNQIARLGRSGIPCVYVTGNHDPGGRQSRLSSILWPENFHVLSSPEPRSVPIYREDKELVARVVGAGHGKQFVEENLARRFPGVEGSVPNIGLLHTFVTSAHSAEEHDRYAPCSVADLKDKGYAYWALGHIHVQQKVDESVDAWYPGILQGRNFGESGDKGGLLVTLPDSGSPQVEFRPFSSTRWEVLRIGHLESVANLNELRTQVETEFQVLNQKGMVDWLLRIELTGPSALTPLLRDEEERQALAEDLEQTLGVRYLEVQTQSLAPQVDVEAFRGETHILSEVLDLLEEAREDDSLLESLKPGDLAGFSSSNQDLKTYLRDLLENMDREAVHRFLGENHAD